MIFTKWSEIVYFNVVEGWLKGPRLMTAKGRIIWTGTSTLWAPSVDGSFTPYRKQGWYSHTGHYVSFSTLIIRTSYLKKKKNNKAFVVASAIPQIQTIVGLIAAVAIMQFTYTFPPILRFGYDVITDAMAADAPYVPGQGARGRVDTWREWSRWKRVRLPLWIIFHQTYLREKKGLFGGRWYFKLFNLILFLGGAVTACMGTHFHYARFLACPEIRGY